MPGLRRCCGSKQVAIFSVQLHPAPAVENRCEGHVVIVRLVPVQRQIQLITAVAGMRQRRRQQAAHAAIIQWKLQPRKIKHGHTLDSQHRIIGIAATIGLIKPEFARVQ